MTFVDKGQPPESTCAFVCAGLTGGSPSSGCAEVDPECRGSPWDKSYHFYVLCSVS